MLLGDMKFRVFNRTSYGIGVKMANGLSYNIAPSSFHIMTADDILFIESTYAKNALFTKKKLVPVNDKGEDIDMAEFGYDYHEDKHSTDTEIEEMLKESTKKIEAWVSKIEDPAELFAIYKVAKNMDLSSSKLKVLNTYIKNRDWIEDSEGETKEA